MSQSFTYPYYAYLNQRHHRSAISLYKNPFPPIISLINATIKSSPTATTPTRTRTTKEVERLIPTQFSSFGSHCLVQNKTMVVIDQHVVWTFFASLFGFVLLYIICRNNNANNRKLKKKTFPEEQCDKNSSTDGECRHVSGSDIVVVGAGVAGSALAYTLAKVHFFFFFKRKNFFFFYFYSILKKYVGLF